MPALDIDDEPAPEPPKATVNPKVDKQASASTPAVPAQASAEYLLVSCCMQDVTRLGMSAFVPPSAISDAKLRKVFVSLLSGMQWNVTPLAEWIRATGMTEVELLRLETAAGLGTGFSGWLREVEDAWRTRERQAIALLLAGEKADSGEIMRRLEALERKRGEALPRRAPSSFSVPLPGDKATLLGDRYLCRGDGCILASSSGMGKSSMLIMMAYLWALARDFFGVKPNGPLRSIVIQSEDSDGDIAEVCLSVRILLGLTEADTALVDERVAIVTDRIHRGPAFIDELRRQIKGFTPDLVMINPFMAFFDGDLNDAREAGEFLRGGLNALNEPATHAYIVVHHTGKPQTSKETRDRKWSEVMYDMTGSAELTNWPRAVISVRPVETEGEFNMVLAKRGRRAGATYMTGEADQYEVVGTTIPIKHTSQTITPPGHEKPIPAIFWERRKPAKEELEGAKRGPGGSQPKHFFSTFKPVFPTSRDHAEGLRRLHGRAKEIRPIGTGAFVRIIDDALEQGLIKVDTTDPQRPKYWVSK